MGIRCPAVYGDPALLLPKLFPEFKKAQHPSLEYVIIPHPFDEHLFVNHPHFFSNREDWDLVIKKILDSKLVISTSLHGLIVAEAFGIPARYLRVSEGEPLFKYEDYYLGTGRRSFSYATTIEEALAMGGELSPQYNLDQLLKAFPFEFFPKSTNRWIDQ